MEVVSTKKQPLAQKPFSQDNQTQDQQRETKTRQKTTGTILSLSVLEHEEEVGESSYGDLPIVIKAGPRH